ncbi:MAG: hypothetical protein ABSG13_31535, partial [Bryobacteraceae bacterium]
HDHFEIVNLPAEHPSAVRRLSSNSENIAGTISAMLFSSLLERVQEREISLADLERLQQWPQWTSENRPLVDTSKPANGAGTRTT